MKKGPTGNSITSRSEPESILILAPNWLGDAVMALPLISAVSASYPEAETTVGCLEYVAPLIERAGIVAKIVKWTRDEGVWTRAGRIRRMIPGGRSDLAIVLPPSFSSALTAFLSKSRERAGYATDGRGCLLTKSISRRELKARHLSDSYLRLLELAGGSRDHDVSSARLIRSNGWQDAVSAAGIEQKYFIVAPGATYGAAKMWPPDRYSRLISRVAERTGLLPVIIGSASQRQVAEEILRGSGREGRVLAGSVGVGAMIDITGGADLFFGNDSGPAHIAAALGVPTIAIFGSTSPEWTAPRGASVKVLYSRARCSPCFRRECPEGTLECLKDISVDMLIEAMEELTTL